MEPAPEPAAKRQRKEPAWKAGFIDPNKLKEYKDGIAVLPSVVDEDGARQPASSSPSGGGADAYPGGPQLLQARAVDHNRVEVVVEHNGRRYRGLMDRTGMPQGVGVAIRVTREELASIAAAPPHGENPNNMCALCNTPLEHPPVFGISDDKADAYMKVRITSNWTARVHMQCAVWCPECKEDPLFPGYYHHMGPAVRRGRALRCRTCRERGATVGCFQEGCPAVYHLTCAVGVQCQFDESTMEVWCPSHTR
ncbi:hypothetical protein Agub_g1780 [Astrephomene gubernaculifera]|uniref:PHD-type domain-containing protein n=1 Tax=Astrephomene gubernaculifera TaxID=47775 RepID=A0AAD3DI38_9CHLO|nr:hypothetical protein Agub_g1780 [Astrephomene gubernaculifera]